MTEMDSSFNLNIHPFIKKAHLECFMGESIKSNGDLDLIINDELVNMVKEGESINNTIMEFYIM